MNIGWVYWVVGQYDRMRDQARRLIELEPNFSGTYWLMGSESWARGNHRQSVSELEKSLALGGGPMVLSFLGCVYGILDQREKAKQVLERLQEMSAHRYVGWFQIALVYAGMGDNDSAFEWLERAYNEREGILIFVRPIAKLLPSISVDQRMPHLIRRIGLPELRSNNR